MTNKEIKNKEIKNKEIKNKDKFLFTNEELEISKKSIKK